MTRAYISEYGGLGANTDNVYAFGTSCFYDSQGNLYVIGSATYGNNTGGAPSGSGNNDSLMLKYSPDGTPLFHKTWWDSDNQNCGATNVAIDIDSQDRIVWLANNLGNSGCFYGVMDTNGNITQGGTDQANAGINQTWPTDITVNNTGAALISTNFQFTNPDVVGHFADVSNIPSVISIPDIITSGTPGWTTGIVVYNADGSLAYGIFNAVVIDSGGYGYAIGNFVHDGIQNSLLVGFNPSGAVIWQYQLDSNTSAGQTSACYAESVSLSPDGYMYTIVTDKGTGNLYLDKWDTGPTSITNIWRTTAATGGPGPLYGYDIDFDSAGNPIVSGISASSTVSNGTATGYPTIVKFDKTSGAMIFANLAILGNWDGGETLWDGSTDPFTGHRCGAVYQDRFAFSCMTVDDLTNTSTTYNPRVLTMQVPTNGSQSVPYTSGPPVGNYLNFTTLLSSSFSTGSYTPVPTTFDTVDLTSYVAANHMPMMAETNATTINNYSETSLTLGTFGTPVLTLRPGTTYRPGVTLRGNILAGYSITLQASDFTQGYWYNTGTIQYPTVLGTNGRDGFTLDLSNIPPDNSNFIYTAYNCYNVNINSQPIADFFNGLVTASILSHAYQPALWHVTWAAGSSITSGYVIMSGTDNSSGGLYIAPVDTTVTGWNTSPPNNNTTTALAGTFLFPATFRLVTPAINKSGWC
jgi:hypothetical protein